MNPLASIVASLLGGFLRGDGASKAVGGFNLLALLGGIGGGIVWLLSPSAALWEITLNARELLGLVVLGALVIPPLLEWVRRLPPPGGS